MLLCEHNASTDDYRTWRSGMYTVDMKRTSAHNAEVDNKKNRCLQHITMITINLPFIFMSKILHDADLIFLHGFAMCSRLLSFATVTFYNAVQQFSSGHVRQQNLGNYLNIAFCVFLCRYVILLTYI